MASTASVLKLIARDASRAARLAAAASRPARSSHAARSAAAAASRAARSAAAAASRAARSSGSVSTYRRRHRISSTCCSCSSSSCSDDDGPDYTDSDDDHSPDDTSDLVQMPGKDVTEKDVESDEAVWALYELWCKAYNKERGLPEMARRFNTFKKSAKLVLEWNDVYKNDDAILGSFADGRDEEDAMEDGPPVGAASMNKV